MDGLTFSNPKLNALKDDLPKYNFASDEPKKKVTGEKGQGETAIENAEAMRDMLRKKARRMAHEEPKKGDLGFIVDPKAMRQKVRPVDTSAAGIAANLASFQEATNDNRAEWSPMLKERKKTPGGAPVERRPGKGPDDSWQPWGDDKPKGRGGRSRPDSAAPKAARTPVPIPNRPPMRPASAKPQIPKEIGGGTPAASGTGTTDGLGRKVFVTDPNVVKASFHQGYNYPANLQPGSCFFSALEAAAKDAMSKNLPPLQLRLPPTIVFGLPALKNSESAGEPLWLWSDVLTGGGLRVMRQPILQVEAALDFLAGAECSKAWVAAKPAPKKPGEASEEPPAAKPKQSEEGKGKSDRSPAGMRPGRRPSKESMLSKDSKDDGGSSAGGGGSSDEEEDSSVQDRLPFADERAARDRLLDTASVVLKSFNVANNGLQELRLLSVRKLAFKLDTRDPRDCPACGEAGTCTPSSVMVYQRFVRPPVSRSCVVRCQHRHVLGQMIRPLRAYSLEAPQLIPRPYPSGTELETQRAITTMCSSSGTQGASAVQVNVRGDGWNEITKAIKQMHEYVRRSLNYHLEELVVELIFTPRGQNPWWLTQVKAFKAVSLGDMPKPSRPVKFKPTVDRPHCIQCVGDFCLGKPAGMELRAASDPIDGLYGEEAVAAAEAAEEALRKEMEAAESGEPVKATRRIPYRWLVFDRLHGYVNHQVEEEDDGETMKGLLSEDSSQLQALATLVESDQPGAKYSRPGSRDVRRSTTASVARAATLRKLYTPASVRRGRPLVCVSSARLYDEVPVCHECYQVYSQMADEWKKKPRALLSVASAPALGLIGQHISELPEEILGVAADTPPPSPRGGDKKSSPGGAPSEATAATTTGLETPAGPRRDGSLLGRPVPSTAATGTSGRASALSNKSSGGGRGSPGPSTGGSPTKVGGLLAALGKGPPKGSLKERSHAMESLLSHSQSTLAFGQNSPLAVAQRFSFLNHCLSCNVLCKACVLREGEEEQLAAMKAEQEEAALMGESMSSGALRAAQKHARMSDAVRNQKMILALKSAHNPKSQIADRTIPVNKQKAREGFHQLSERLDDAVSSSSDEEDVRPRSPDSPRLGF